MGYIETVTVLLQTEKTLATTFSDFSLVLGTVKVFSGRAFSNVTVNDRDCL